MKRIVFLTSHLCSGVYELMDLLNQNPRIDLRGNGMQYVHPSDLYDLYKLGHKLRNSAAVYGDYLVFNHDLQHKRFYSFSNFIYLVRPARLTLNEIIHHPNSTYDEDSAYRYYVYRLRRICEMAKRTPNAVLLTYQNLIDGNGFGLIDEMLELNQPLIPNPERFQQKSPNTFSSDLIKKAEDSYERHLYFLRQLNHLRQV